MSLGYNDRLKKGIWKGICGDNEFRDNQITLEKKLDDLVDLIKSSDYTIAFTGAGVSTSCGIPDFRWPQGVWTAEQKGVEPPSGIDFDKAMPSFTHMALKAMMDQGIIKHIVSQNVDGLHLKSGVPRENISELHGNIFAESCDKCGTEYIRDFDIKGMGLQHTGRLCDDESCRGKLRDKTVDWDSDLPQADLDTAIRHCRNANLCLCLGSSLRIKPAGDMPRRTLRLNGKDQEGKIVIVNYQKTHLDSLATIRIFANLDDVMRHVTKKLGVSVAEVERAKITETLPNKTVEETLSPPEHEDGKRKTSRKAESKRKRKREVTM